MSLQEYPAIETSADTSQVIDILRRIIDLRYEDVVLLNELLRTESYNSGFARSSLSVGVDLLVGEDNFAIDVDASGAARTITLLSDPKDGLMHIISKSDATANNITIDGNGNNINGAASISFNTQYEGRYLIYMGGSGEWRALTM